MDSLRCSGELAARFGCYLPTKSKGKTYVWAEVNPELMERGALKNEQDKAFLRDRCTELLLQDGLIHAHDNSYLDSHRNKGAFPKHRSDSQTVCFRCGHHCIAILQRQRKNVCCM
jgi:hypothetical protein